MGRPYSFDLGERVVSAVRSVMSRREAAKFFSIGISSAIRWTKREGDTGSPAALPMGGKRPFSLAMERPWVLSRLEAKPDLTLRALLSELRERGVTVSYYAVWNIVHWAGKSFKKACTPPNRIARTSPASARSGSGINTRLTLGA